MYIAKTHEIIKMRAACHATASLLDHLGSSVQEGISTGELDYIAKKFIIEELGARPANLNYNGFPASICTSINEIICHGVPSPHAILKAGDIVNVDVAVELNGVYGDASRMFAIGAVSPKANQLIVETKQALDLAINIIQPGLDINEIGKVIERHAHKFNFGCVNNYCGHGIGKKYHQWPNICHVDLGYNTGIRLHEGMIFTIEPIFTASLDTSNHILADNWSVVSSCNELSAQWEHTILVTSTGAEILTL